LKSDEAAASNEKKTKALEKNENNLLLSAQAKRDKSSSCRAERVCKHIMEEEQWML
jgi:hypothetical protein